MGSLLLASDPEEVDNLVLRRRASTLNQPHGKSKPKAMAVVLLVVIILGVPFVVLGGIGVTALRSYQIDTSLPTTWQIIAADNASSTLESWQRVDIYTGETTSAMFFRAVWHAPMPFVFNESNNCAYLSDEVETYLSHLVTGDTDTRRTKEIERMSKSIQSMDAQMIAAGFTPDNRVLTTIEKVLWLSSVIKFYDLGLTVDKAGKTPRILIDW